MRILALVTDAFGGRGGIASATRATLAAFAASGRCQSIVVLPRAAPEEVRAPEGVSQLAPVTGRVRYALRAMQLARAIRPDIVYCNHLFMAPLARWAARISGAKLVLHMHGIEIWQAPRRAQLEALEAADLVLAVSRYTRRAVLRHASLVPEKVVVLNNTFDRRFTLGDRAGPRARLGIGDDQVLLLTVGRLAASEQYKGHDRVLEALAAIELSPKRSIQYLIAGDGDDRARLKAHADRLGLGDVVRFAGYTEDKDLPDLYRAADLFLMPSTGEGFGIAFLEAMACGTPALGLAVGGATDALADGELGSCVAAKDFATALAELIERNARPDDLASKTKARFGEEVFRNQAQAVLSALAGVTKAELAPV